MITLETVDMCPQVQGLGGVTRELEICDPRYRVWGHVILDAVDV